MTSLATEKLADLIGKRLSCLTQLRDLGRKQSDLISTGEMGSLLRLIAAKNRLIIALQAVEQQLAPYHAHDPESRQWESPERRAECAVQASACTQLLEEAMQLERDNEKKLTLRRDCLAGQLQAAQAAGTARAAYQAQQRWQGSRCESPTASQLETDGPDSQLDIHSEA